MSRFISFVAGVFGASVVFAYATFAANPTAQEKASLQAALTTVNSVAGNSNASQVAATAKSAAQAFIHDLVANAIAAAQAANPNITPDELARVANAAANSDFAISGLSAIATTTVSQLLAAQGRASDAGAANATAQTVVANVNAGSSLGLTAASGNLGNAAATITAPVVSISLSVQGNSTTIAAATSNGRSVATAEQTIAGQAITPLKTVVEPAGTPNGGANNASNNPILPPLDQTQPVVSPATSTPQ